MLKATPECIMPVYQDKEFLFEGTKVHYVEGGAGEPILLLHGRNDHPVPASVTLQIAGSLPQANVILIGNCSHSVAFEHPERLLSACRLLF